MDSKKPRGDQAAPASAGLAKPAKPSSTEPAASARVLPLRRAAPPTVPVDPDDDPGPRAA